MNTFNLKQKNELLTGVQMSVELPSSSPELRRFLTVSGYALDENNKHMPLSKYLNRKQDVHFYLRCYDILSDFYDTSMYDPDYYLKSDLIIDDIKGLDELELKLKDFIDDFSILQPDWYCEDQLLE